VAVKHPAEGQKTLPRSPRQPGANRKFLPVDASGLPRYTSVMKKVLIVEDDESTQELLKHIVSAAGYDVATASDGQAGLSAVVNSPPDLVVLDVMLPEIHGYSVCHQIKSNEVLKVVKVLMLSAKSFPADRRQAEEVGADAFLAKPVNPAELVEKIKSLLAAA